MQIQALSMVTISKLLKTYLGWDKLKPIGGIVICKSLSQKVLHTFFLEIFQSKPSGISLSPSTIDYLSLTSS